MTMEQILGMEPDVPPEPLPKRTRRLSNEDDGGLAERQYDAYLDRLGGE